MGRAYRNKLRIQLCKHDLANRNMIRVVLYFIIAMFLLISLLSGCSVKESYIITEATSKADDNESEYANYINSAIKYLEENTIYDKNNFSEISCTYKDNYKTAEKTYREIFIVYFMPQKQQVGGDVTVIVNKECKVLDYYVGE